MVFDGPVVSGAEREIHGEDEVPDGADLMVRGYQFVQKTRLKIALVAVRSAKAREQWVGRWRAGFGHKDGCSVVHV